MSGCTDRQNVEERKSGEMRWGSVAGEGGWVGVREKNEGFSSTAQVGRSKQGCCL